MQKDSPVKEFNTVLCLIYLRKILTKRGENNSYSERKLISEPSLSLDSLLRNNVDKMNSDYLISLIILVFITMVVQAALKGIRTLEV